MKKNQKQRFNFGIGLGLSLMLSACGNGAKSPPQPVSPIITPLYNVSDYLAQKRCPNGDPPHMCENPVAQTADDPMFWRRQDIGNYQTSDCVVSGDKYITTWSYYPFREFVAANGDGGEIYELRNDGVYIHGTQHGGVDYHTFGNYWWLFDAGIEIGKWKQGGVLNRARREIVTFPATGYGLSSITADTIISEHYDLPNQTGKLERFYFAKDLCRVLWQAWVPPQIHNPPVDLDTRCPMVSWDGPPAERPDWRLQDCRLTTNFVPWDGKFSVTQFGWEP